MIPFILAAVGGYLIGDSMKGQSFADGGMAKGGKPKVIHTQFEEEEFEYADGGMMAKDECQRCHNNTYGITTMSMFNEDIICMICKEEEKKHPDYEKAVNSDIEEIKKGNYNFKGIGLAKGVE